MEILIGSLTGFALIGQKFRTSRSERMAAQEQARASRMAALDPEPELLVGRLMTGVVRDICHLQGTASGRLQGCSCRVHQMGRRSRENGLAPLSHQPTETLFQIADWPKGDVTMRDPGGDKGRRSAFDEPASVAERSTDVGETRRWVSGGNMCTVTWGHLHMESTADLSRLQCGELHRLLRMHSPRPFRLG